VEKQVLEAGLGNVDVQEIDAGGGGEVDDLGDEGAAAVGIEVGGISGGGADLADTGERGEGRERSGRRGRSGDAAGSLRGCRPSIQRACRAR